MQNFKSPPDTTANSSLKQADPPSKTRWRHSESKGAGTMKCCLNKVWFFPVCMYYSLQLASSFSKYEALFPPWGITYAGITKCAATWLLGTQGLCERSSILRTAMTTLHSEGLLTGSEGLISVPRSCAIPDPSSLGILKRKSYLTHFCNKVNYSRGVIAPEYVYQPSPASLPRAS